MFDTIELYFGKKNPLDKLIFIKNSWFKHILLSDIYNSIEHKFYNLYEVLYRRIVKHDVFN